MSPVFDKPVFERVSLLGVGLIGSSLSHAMRRGGVAGHIAGYEPTKAVLGRARKVGFADSLHDDIAGGAAHIDWNDTGNKACKLGVDGRL